MGEVELDVVCVQEPCVGSSAAMTSSVFGAGVGLTHCPDRALSLILLCAKDSGLRSGLASSQPRLFPFPREGFCCLTWRL